MSKQITKNGVRNVLENLREQRQFALDNCYLDGKREEFVRLDNLYQSLYDLYLEGYFDDQE